jgi:hypothetical protein
MMKNASLNTKQSTTGSCLPTKSGRPTIADKLTDGKQLGKRSGLICIAFMGQGILLRATKMEHDKGRLGQMSYIRML